MVIKFVHGERGQIGRVIDPVYLPQDFPKIPLLGLVFGLFLCYTLVRFL